MGAIFVTIVVVSYQRPRNVPVIVHSLLAQTIQNFQIIFLHDGPHEPTRLIISDLYARHPNQIAYFFTNKRYNDYGHSLREMGIAMADGDYLLITNDDNYYSPKFIEYMCDEIAQKNLDIVLCDMIHSHQDLGLKRESHNLLITEPRRYHADIGCFLARTELAKKAGFRDKTHDGDATYLEDYCHQSQILQSARSTRCCLFTTDTRPDVRLRWGDPSHSGGLRRTTLPIRNALPDHAKQLLDTSFFERAKELGADPDLLAAISTPNRPPPHDLPTAQP